MKKHFFLAILAISLLLCLGFVVVFNTLIIPSNHYNKAVEMLQLGKMSDAALEFGKAGKYKDAEIKVGEIFYRNAEILLDEGDYYGASASFGNAGTFSDALSRKYDIERRFLHSSAFSVGDKHFAGVNTDGTVFVPKGDNDYGACDVSDWNDIEAVAAGGYQTVGLHSDGTIIVAGYKTTDVEGLTNTSDWKNVVSIAAAGLRFVALLSDGTVRTMWFTSEVADEISKWRDIVAVAMSPYHCVGLHSDGTVVAAGGMLNGHNGCNDVSNWRGIIAVAAGPDYTIGLHIDGSVSVAATYPNNYTQIYGWHDIKAIFSGNCPVGLRKDGTIVTDGSWANDFDIHYFEDVLAVGTSNDKIIGLQSDGQIVGSLKNHPFVTFATINQR